MSDMQPCAGQFRELHVARHAHRFGGRRHSAETEPQRSHALAHHRAARERNIFRVFNHRQIERPAIIHHLPRELGRRDGLPVVGNRYDARLFHSGNLCNRLAPAPDRGRANGPHAHRSRCLGAVQNEPRHRSIVIHRICVRHRAYDREAASRRRARSRLDGFRRFLARLAQVRMQVDKSRRNHEARGVKHLPAGVSAEASRLGHLGDFAAVDKDVAGRIGMRRRVDHPAVLNHEHWRIPWISWSLPRVTSSPRAPGARRLPRRPRSPDTGWPCARPRRWSPVRARTTAPRRPPPG